MIKFIALIGVIFFHEQCFSSFVTQSWTRVYLPRIFLDKPANNRLTVPGYSEAHCAFAALQIREWVNLFCFLDNQCVMTELLMEPSQKSTGLEAPVKCMTRFRKGDKPCKLYASNTYSGYGCFHWKTGQVSQAQARAYCQTLGMDIPTYGHLQNPTVVQKLGSDLGITVPYWVGAFRVPPASHFLWITGELLRTTDHLWYATQPTLTSNEIHAAKFINGLHDVLYTDLYHTLCAFSQQ